MSHAPVIQGTQHGVWLWTLWAAFGLRVLALLAIQLMMLVAMAAAAW
jgi:hypothetical protein